MMSQAELIDQLYQTAISMPNIDVSFDEALKICKRRNDVEFIGRDWLLVEIISMPDHFHRIFLDVDIKPVIVISRDIIYQKNRGYFFDMGLCSSYVVGMEGCLFHTMTGCLLLIGSGFSTRVNYQTILEACG